MAFIGDIFDIPERVHQGDFVLRLTEGLEGGKAAQTLANYVVTPQLTKAFDQALGLIKGAVEANSSKGGYLHGSFGSGKSHFMAVLSLLLDGNADARSIPELAEVVSKHNRWTEGRRFLVVPYHMIGATSLESRVLGGYAEHTRKRHPDAPTPGFYRSESIFADAQGIREAMGDDAFFEKLGGKSDGGWGSLDSWDAESYAAAQAAAPASPERTNLVSSLIDAFFPNQAASAADDAESFVSIDEGLSIMSHHAQALGYDGIVLFLDELILWLASHAADMGFVSREIQKVVKLVEASSASRPIPLVSFIARQRDLRELVGEHMPGAEELAFADILNYWSARFDTITLEDRNLPAIAQKRLLRPKTPQAAQELEQAFERTAKVREEVLSTLLTRDGNTEMFRQIYPFSPALIQSLIALSSFLQRERTALKLMSQLLIEQRQTLELGDVMPVGDLFDVIMDGDEPFMQGMRITFDNAKRLYRQKLLPMLEREHDVTAEAVREGKVDPAVAKRFRTDDRLLKTLLLSAMAPVEALSALTPARLAALNHGSIKTPIPGQEGAQVLRKVRQWAAQVGEIKVSEDGANPVISVHLAGVDTDAIIENAKSVDNFGNRVNMVRRIVFEQLKLDPSESGGLFNRVRRDFLWRGTKRHGHVLFNNVRELSLDAFEFDGEGWQVVIDFPFDRDNYTPRDDRAKVREFADKQKQANTIVWLPNFFHPRAQQDLARLVILEHVLQGNNLSQYSGHLSQLEREQAKVLLQNQRDQLVQRIRGAILEAYGVSRVSGSASAIDHSIDLDEHVVSLNAAHPVKPPVGADLLEAMEHLLTQALDSQYPKHPRFEGDVTLAGLRNVWALISKGIEAGEERIEVERRLRPDMSRIAVPLELGVMGETHFVIQRAWTDHLTRKRAEEPDAPVTVSQLRAWLDQPEPRGMPREVQNLLILVYAAQTGSSFMLHGARIDPRLESLDDALELRQEALPDAALWSVAVARAAKVFGLPIVSLLNASKVAELVEGVTGAASEKLATLAGYEKTLLARLEAEGLAGAGGPVARAATARAARELLSVLKAAPRDEVVSRLAEFSLKEGVSEVGLGAVIARAEEMQKALSTTKWEIFAGLRAREDAESAAVLRTVREALSRDEHVTSLKGALAKAETDAIGILTRTPPVAPPPTAGPDRGGAISETNKPAGIERTLPGREERRALTAEQVMAIIKEHPHAVFDLAWTKGEAPAR